MARENENTEPPPEGWVECDGDFIPADHIRFEETVWRSGKRLGARDVVAEVQDPEQATVQEHWSDVGKEADWVYLMGIACEGEFPSEVEGLFRRKRRNVERNGVIRRLWTDESARTRLAEIA